MNVKILKISYHWFKDQLKEKQNAVKKIFFFFLIKRNKIFSAKEAICKKAKRLKKREQRLV